MEFLFSYGTLLPEHAPAEIEAVARKLRPVGAGTVTGWLYDLGEFPGVILDRNTSATVSGRVFEVPNPAILEALDTYEGYDPADEAVSLFVRRKGQISMQDGSKLTCWIYVYNQQVGSAPLIPHGEYSKQRVG